MSNTRFYCNVCRNKTWHEVAIEYQQTYHDNFWGYDRLLQAQILKCCGCEYLSFRLFEHPMEFQEKGEIQEYVYPEREFKKRKRVYIFTLPRDVSKLYRQTLKAYDNELYLLSAIGLRALLEAVVIKRLDPSEYSRSIHSKIEALRKYFNSDVIDTLQEFRFMGNQAVHSLQEPAKLDIHRALNVIEAIMMGFSGVEDSVKSFKDLREKK
jgi:hypothetical protein